MSASRFLTGFLVRFAVIDALLLIVWPLASTAYRGSFRTIGEIAFAEMCGAVIHLEATPHEQEESRRPVKDIVFVIENRAASAIGRINGSTYYTGYVPTALICAIVLATPLPCRRRLRTLLFALLFIHAFIGLRVWLLLLSALNNSGPLSTFSLGRVGDSALSFVAELLAVAPSTTFIAPLLIWGLLMSVRPNRQAIMQCIAKAESPSADKTETAARR
jgi:hypothetical protein